MKLSSIWDQYTSYTKTVSEQARKLAFAGAAVCWFFRTPEATFPILILIALLLIVVFFLADLGQYIFAAQRYRTFAREQEEAYWESERPWEQGEGIPDIEVEVPVSLDKLSQSWFIFKVCVLTIAYVFMIGEFLIRIIQH